MIKKKWDKVLAGVTLLAAVAGASALALAVNAATPAPTATAEDEVTRHLAPLIERVSGQKPVLTVLDSPVKGLKMVEIERGPTVYVTEDGRHLFEGELLDISGGAPIDVARSRLQGRVRAALQTLKADDWIVMGATEPKARVYVFTDTSCPYCRQLHQEVPALAAQGIEVRYLPYPRGGQGGAAWATMQSIWCAEDRAAALTKAKAGEATPEARCDRSIGHLHALGDQMGVRGTPTIVLESGETIDGYLPADQLATRALGAL